MELLWSEKSEGEIRPADFAASSSPSSCTAEWKELLRPMKGWDILGLNTEGSKRDATEWVGFNNDDAIIM